MSEPENCVKPTQCRCRRWILIVVAAVAVLVLLCHVLHPTTYTATAYIQILTQRPYFIYSEQERMQYEQYVETQFAIMRSPLIIDKALENPEVARLASIERQRDKAGWLSKKLKLRRQGDSEMVTVSISLRNPEEPDKIVNAVVNAFFDYYATQCNEWNHKLITQLNLEYNRQQAAVRLLQDEIRSAMEQAAKQGVAGDDVLPGPAQNELLLKDIYQSELKLMEFQAELKAMKEVAAKPESMLTDLQKQIMEKETAVRAAEILIADLKTKYKQQLADIGKRTVTIDVSFQQAQLERYNKVLDLLQNRITKLETERHAPEQIQLRKRAAVPQRDRRCCL